MKVILQTRLIFWKKKWLSHLFWLLFPMLLTWYIIVQFVMFQADTKVPVGVVLEEDTPSAQALLDSLDETPHIRPILLNEREALNQLQKHELDSVFIVRRHYEKNIQKGSRNQVIKSYQSDLSFAYIPLRETVISYVQQDYSRYKAAQVVQRMGEEYGIVDQWTDEELIERSRDIEKEQNLLDVSFSFTKMEAEDESDVGFILNPWGLWALFSMLATFMLFDWVIREKHSPAILRFAYGRLSLEQYFLGNMILYLFLLLCFDLLAVVMFNLLLDESITYGLILSIILYRMMLTSCIFLWSTIFRSTYLYYTSSFAIVLFISLTSGAVIPIDGLGGSIPWFRYLNPLDLLLSGTYMNVWLIIGIALTSLWYVRKGAVNAKYSID